MVDKEEFLRFKHDWEWLRSGILGFSMALTFSCLAFLYMFKYNLTIITLLIISMSIYCYVIGREHGRDGILNRINEKIKG
jgi:hypothetical protein